MEIDVKTIRVCDNAESARKLVLNCSYFVTAYEDERGRLIFVSLAEIDFSEKLPFETVKPDICHNGCRHYDTKFSKNNLLEFLSKSEDRQLILESP